MQPFMKMFKKGTSLFLHGGVTTKIRRATLLAVLCAVGLIPAVHPVMAETKVQGTLSKDTKWTLEGSPYIVTGDIVVASNARLSIIPGVIVLCNPTALRDTSIRQYDHLDSFSVAIKVEGCLDCVGKKEKRIVFQPAAASAGSCSWYGIIFNKAPDNYAEIAFSDITGAYNGVTAVECGPLMRNCIIEQNNVGITCLAKGNFRVYNCVITGNFTAGVKIQAANPVFFNNIIAFNRNNGVWCDGMSRITFRYNCVWGNADGDFLECDPELGVVVTAAKKNADSLDKASNIRKNPVFAGSAFDSMAVEKDLSLPTEKSRIADTALAKILYTSLADSLAVKKRKTSYARFSLSHYSPCIHKGNPAKEFNNHDGSRNDMGIYGGPEYSGSKAK